MICPCFFNPFTTIYDGNFRRHSSSYITIHDGNFGRIYHSYTRIPGSWYSLRTGSEVVLQKYIRLVQTSISYVDHFASVDNAGCVYLTQVKVHNN